MILALLVAGVIIISIRQNDGHIIYTLDDSYIHMALAKNLAQHGVWGITRYEFFLFVVVLDPAVGGRLPVIRRAPGRPFAVEPDFCRRHLPRRLSYFETI